MNCRLLLSVGVAVAALAGSGSAGAVPLLFNFSGPSGTASFQLDSNPTPDFSSTFIGSDQFGFDNVVGTFGGMPGTASIITFGSGSIFSSFSVTAPNLGFTQFSSPTLFTGSRTMPVFLTGSFTLINPFFGNGTLSISQVQSAVPEPGIWAMLLVGFALTGTALRYRRLGTAVTVGWPSNPTR